MLLSELFDVINGYPSSHVTVKEFKEDNCIPYIRPSSDYLNVTAGYVEKSEIPNRYIFPPETIFVSTDGQGSHSYSYVSNFSFVPNSNVAVLIPKRHMDLNEKIYYALCITKNRFKFSYGRKPKGVRLLNINLPDSAPDWVFNRETAEQITAPLSDKSTPEIDMSKWKGFIYTDLFEIKKGKRVTKKDLYEGTTPFIGAIDSNNGYREYCNLPPLFNGNVITVPYNGNGVGEAFYQPIPFWASDDINVLVPKFELNPFIAMFIITIIRKEKYRFNYGRKWHKERMEESTIKLPVKDGKPDWKYMENYIKTLPYSSSL